MKKNSSDSVTPHLASLTTREGNLAFSDPANVIPMPEWAVGKVSRSADLDVTPGFHQPPPGFGVVPFYWWLGDPLTKERLIWQLEQMTGMAISGYQINYAHTDKGGISFGLTFPSKPALFSPEWWQLTGWFMGEAKKQDACISLSDYTLGFGQGWLMDEILREHPDVFGIHLELITDNPPADSLIIKTVPGPDGNPQRVGVVAVKVPGSLNPLHPLSGKYYAEKFFGEFERRFPGECGKGLNFFFSDELGFGIGGHLWTERFAEEFKSRKGYDIVPELLALFMDIGSHTPKVRLDYSDVRVALSEEGFFKPVFDWHQQRGMTMGCDHGGRGYDVCEFGDYFRTQRWNQGPGADQPHLNKNLIKTKVASSIAHLYERPRVWLEGFHSSGWGTSSASLIDATLANYVMGYNLLSFHGMYYSTHGGWWEWAPPDNTFRMPYWQHLRGFMGCIQRLSYLLSQGHHRCDVAILYPVAPTEADMGGPESMHSAVTTAVNLYDKSIDFDYMDFESLDRATIVGKELHVSGEIYRVLILPAMKAVRHSTLQKALAFHRAGGLVLAVDALPEASDRIGRNDPEVAAIVKELFPQGAITDVVAQVPCRDYQGPGYVQHRKIGPRDLYALYNAPKDTVCFFRATGKVELWDPWTGTTRPLAVTSQTAEGTSLKLPLTETEIQLIVFSPGEPIIESGPHSTSALTRVAIEGEWEFELKPICDNRFGDYHWPPTAALIGAEARQVWYCEGESAQGPWRKVTCSFGPQFLRTDGTDAATSAGTPYEFSWRWGSEVYPAHQGYQGLKEIVDDNFIILGKTTRTWIGWNYEPAETASFFKTSVIAPHDMTAHALTGAIKPVKVWLNGTLVDGSLLQLKAGANSLVLEYAGHGRTYFIVSTEPGQPEPVETNERPVFKDGPLTMSWFNNPTVLPFDLRAAESKPVGWYRFTSPPGLHSMTLKARGKVQAWADGHELKVSGNKLIVTKSSAKPAEVLLRIEQERGCYGGAALPEPIQMECNPGLIALGDWAAIDGLLSYSGGAWYRKTVTIPAAREVTLDLGNVVASVEVFINGHPAGVRTAPPWRFDITPWAKPGTNRIEVLVCNTLANHYTTIPTLYRGETISGLLGPVSIETLA